MEEKTFTVTFLGEPFGAHYVTSKDSAQNHLQDLIKKEVLFGIDTETECLPKYSYNKDAPLSPHLGRIRLLQVFDGKDSFVFDLKKIGDNQMFIPFLESKKFIAHNAMFEIVFLKKLGCKKLNIGCTRILSTLITHAVFPTDSGVSVSLENMVKSVFKEEIVKTMQVSDWSIEELTFEQVEYAALDAVLTLKLAERLASAIKKFGLERIYKLCKEVQHPISEIQLNGIKINIPVHREQIVKWRTNLYEAKKKVLELTGLKELTSTKIGEWLEEKLDPDTLALWPKTDTGKLSTDAHTFSDFDYLDIVAPFKEFQKASKLTASFGQSLLSLVNTETGRLHSSYWICGARTGRMSSSKPNLQQLPRDSDVRKNFIPEAGNIFVRADYSQIEIRVGAELSRDKQMLEAYKKGIDLHYLTASIVGKIPITEVSKEDRQKAKALNFGLMFGLGAKKFSHYAKMSYGVEVSQEEANESIKIWRNLYEGYRVWQLAQADNASKTFIAETPCGKKRKLESDNYYGASMNTPVQGGAAEIMMYALIFLQRDLDTLNINAKIVNCIHDEILIECPDKDKEFVANILEHSMLEGFKEVFPQGITKNLVGLSSGYSWEEAKE